jgi:hypothetical protein
MFNNKDGLIKIKTPVKLKNIKKKEKKDNTT